MALLPAPAKRQANNNNGSTPLVSTTNDGVLPLELLFEILLFVPVKAACRLRAVCRSWRSLLSHWSFIAAHKARHPLVTISRRSNLGRTIDVYLIDTSGHMVKQVCAHERAGPCTTMNCTHPDMVCLVGEDRSIRVLDPATGAISVLPPPDDKGQFLSAVTRYKGEEPVQDWKVLTVGGGGGGGWRDMQSPPTSVLLRPVEILSGVLYVMAASRQEIAALYFDKEQWRPNPIPVPPQRPGDGKTNIRLAELKGRLVFVRDCPNVSMELWFLMDAERAAWFKQYTVDNLYDGSCIRGGGAPLWMWEDEKILFWSSGYGAVTGKGSMLGSYERMT